MSYTINGVVGRLLYISYVSADENEKTKKNTHRYYTVTNSDNYSKTVILNHLGSSQNVSVQLLSHGLRLMFLN